MQRNIQIRHVPDAIHRTLRTRAAQAGMTLSDFLLAELTVIAERPTLEDVLARIRARPHEVPRTSSARAVRAEREGRR
jgi:plasmid stability protein